MTDTPTRQVLFVTGRPERWREAQAALRDDGGFSLTVTDSVPVVGAIGADVDCVVGTHDEETDGLEFLERVRAARPALPFVLLASGDEGAVASRAVEADVSGFVPGSTDDAAGVLRDRVESALAEPRAARDGGAVPMPIDDVSIREELRL